MSRLRLSKYVSPLFGMIRPDPASDEIKGRSILGAIDAARGRIGSDVLYALMVRSYPADRIASTDSLSVWTTAGTDTTTIAATHYARVHGYVVSVHAGADYDWTSGALTLVLGTKKLMSLSLRDEFGDLQGHFAMPVMFPVPIDGAIGDDIVLTAPVFGAGTLTANVHVFYEDIIGNPLTV